MSRAPAVRLTGLTRRFGEQRALDAVSLEIGEEEFFSMLGPSGSGKTTCLRLIAGFDEPDAGGIELHGVPAVGVPAWERWRGWTRWATGPGPARSGSDVSTGTGTGE